MKGILSLLKGNESCFWFGCWGFFNPTKPITQTADKPTEVAVVIPTKRPGVEVVVSFQSPAGQRPFLKLDLVSAKPMALEGATSMGRNLAAFPFSSLATIIYVGIEANDL